ncbi:MAG TPA: response regulator, partial [Spirillospora sp.]|nr:response regulator [Spirillospora sp.]
GVVELVLDYHNASVRSALSGQQCLAALRNEIPSLLMLDIQMPDMSGFDLLEKIRENPAWRDIPAVAITAHVMAGDQERILAAGFDGYIPKPINALTLVDEIMAIIAARG